MRARTAYDAVWRRVGRCWGGAVCSERRGVSGGAGWEGMGSRAGCWIGGEGEDEGSWGWDGCWIWDVMVMVVIVVMVVGRVLVMGRETDGGVPDEVEVG